MIVAPILFLLMIVNIETVSAVFLLALAKSSRPVAGLVAFAALCAFAVPVSSLLFHFESLLAGLPVLSWTTSGILFAARGDLSSAAAIGAILAALPMSVAVIGSRFC
jgi:hypothetical protein